MPLPITDFIVEKLLEFDSSFDTGAGVPTTGLMIEPLSVILQPIIDELTVAQASQSVLTILESSDPDAFPEDIVDGLASNAFVERNTGNIGSDVVRVRYFEPTNFSSQKGVLIFRGPSGQRYSNSEAVSVTSAEMSLNQEGSLFFVDIPIVALEEGEAFNVDPGGITQMEAEPVGVANVTNLFGIEDGRDRETNTELIDRIKVAVTVRALVTGRGIVVTLTENFTTIEEIQPIGFGDPEMMRDIVYNVHIGGNVDVYIKTATLSESFKDIFGLEVDTTRRRPASSTVVALEESVGYSLGRAPIDRTDTEPRVVTIDEEETYSEGTDYEIDDTTALFVRVPGSGIFHRDVSSGDVTDTKTLEKTGAFANVRPGMIITVSTPGSVAGTYTVKEVPDNDTVTIYGTFAVSTVSGVDFQIDDNLVVSFEYNPVSIDIAKEARTGREDFTITDVPIMYISSIEVLDPLSGNPTGEVLNALGGFGAGGFGMGPFGIGTGADYDFVVAEPTLRFSWLENNYLVLRDSFVGTAVRVNYKYASGIPPIQAFMDDRNNQSQSASLLARYFIPVFVDGTEPIEYQIPSATSTTAPTVDEMTTVFKDFIDDVDSGDDLELSDLVDLLYDNGASKVDIGTMRTLRGEIHNQDGSVEFTSPDDSDVIAIPNDTIPDPSDKPLSSRIARFIARDIELERTLK